MTLPAFAAIAAAHATPESAGTAAVWRHFDTLCRTPRVSKHEDVLRDTLRDWALARGLATEIDVAGNLIIRKPATDGCADKPGVILQGHLDMVCQANNGVVHDFFKDPIRPVLRDGWLIAEQTTLGADNGIGVALALAALEADDVRHGPLEVLLTVDEEAGMGGAKGLQPGTLRGRYLINIDTEDWGEFYIGCAGGVDVNITGRADWAEVGAGGTAFAITVRGLRGGHSGADIHLGRGNAIKLLVRTLCAAAVPLRLAGFSGGTARNAIPREASATLVCDGPTADALVRMQATVAAIQGELLADEPGLQIDITPCPVPAHALSPATSNAWLAALHAAPIGVRRMSNSVPGVVETSNNLGVAILHEDQLEANLMVRSLIDSASLALGEEIASGFRLAGFTVELDGHYPGWKPNPASPLLATSRAVYDRIFAAEFGASKVQVIHAGLECGILGASHPEIDMVSFGPTIRGAHAPGERVEVAAVDRCWQLLAALLAELAR